VMAATVMKATPISSSLSSQNHQLLTSESKSAGFSSQFARVGSKSHLTQQANFSCKNSWCPKSHSSMVLSVSASHPSPVLDEHAKASKPTCKEIKYRVKHWLVVRKLCLKPGTYVFFPSHFPVYPSLHMIGSSRSIHSITSNAQNRS
jgi:hypothetical protein